MLIFNSAHRYVPADLVSQNETILKCIFLVTAYTVDRRTDKWMDRTIPYYIPSKNRHLEMTHDIQNKLECAASNGNRYPPYPQVMATAISQ